MNLMRKLTSHSNIALVNGWSDVPFGQSQFYLDGLLSEMRVVWWPRRLLYAEEL